MNAQTATPLNTANSGLFIKPITSSTQSNIVYYNNISGELTYNSSLASGSASITGGSINNTTIGSITETSGKFSDLTATGTLGVSGAATFNGSIVYANEQTLTTTGAVDLTKFITYVEAGAGGITGTIANGTVGQMKVFIVTDATNGSIIIPSSVLGTSVATFPAGLSSVGKSVTYVYTSSGWAIVSNNGATLS